MNINAISNETLAKLTAAEVGALDLCNYGVGLYKGQLKSRKANLKTVKVSENEVYFEATNSRIEFVRLVKTGDIDEWAARIYRRAIEGAGWDCGYYDTNPMGIFGCDFFKNEPWTID